MLNRLPIKDQLATRDTNVDNSLYPFCVQGGKKVKHLFFTCTFAREVWDICSK